MDSFEWANDFPSYSYWFKLQNQQHCNLKYSPVKSTVFQRPLKYQIYLLKFFPKNQINFVFPNLNLSKDTHTKQKLTHFRIYSKNNTFYSLMGTEWKNMAKYQNLIAQYVLQKFLCLSLDPQLCSVQFLRKILFCLSILHISILFSARFFFLEKRIQHRKLLGDNVLNFVFCLRNVLIHIFDDQHTQSIHKIYTSNRNMTKKCKKVRNNKKKKKKTQKEKRSGMRVCKIQCGENDVCRRVVFEYTHLAFKGCFM